MRHKTRTDSILIRLRPSERALIARLIAPERRGRSELIRELLRREAARRGIIEASPDLRAAA